MGADSDTYIHRMESINLAATMARQHFDDPEVSLKRVQEKFRKVMTEVDENLSFDTDYQQPWAESNLETAIEDVIITPAAGRKSGVAVVLAPRGCGKSTRVKQVAKHFVKQRILRGAVYMRASDVCDSVPLGPYFANMIGIQLPETRTFSDLIPERDSNESSSSTRVLLIFDQVEKIASHPGFARFFSSIACDSSLAQEERSFFCITLCSHTSAAETLLLLNGGSKLYAPIRDTGLVGGGSETETWRSMGVKLRKNQTDAFVKKRLKYLLNTTQDLDEFLTKQKRYTDCAEIAGTIQFCRDVAEVLSRVFHGETSKNIDSLEAEAYRINGEWQHFSGFEVRASALCAEKCREEILPIQ